MSKPKTAILKDCEIPFKDVCVMFEADTAWFEGKKFKLPLERWKEE